MDWLAKLEKSLPGDCLEGIAVGSRVSYADVAVWSLLSDTFIDSSDAAKSKAAADSCPKLRRIAAAVGNLPAVQSWLANRPSSMF